MPASIRHRAGVPLRVVSRDSAQTSNQERSNYQERGRKSKYQEAADVPVLEEGDQANDDDYERCQRE